MSNADRSIWQFPKNVANKVPGWRSDGKGLENKDWADPASKQDASPNLTELAAVDPGAWGKEVLASAGDIPDSDGSSWMDGKTPAIISRGTPKFLMPEQYTDPLVSTQLIYCPGGNPTDYSGSTDFQPYFEAMFDDIRANLLYDNEWPPTGTSIFRMKRHRAAIALQPGHRYRVGSSIPAWGIDSRGFTFQANGGVIVADYADGDAVLDLLGCSGWNVNNLKIEADNNNSPNIGILIGRPGDNIAATDMQFTDCYVDGWFKKAGVYNFAGEVFGWRGGEITTRAIANTDAPALWIDSRNTLDVSLYSNHNDITIAANTDQSCVMHTIERTNLRSQSAGTPGTINGALRIDGQVSGSVLSVRKVRVENTYVTKSTSTADPFPGVVIKGQVSDIILDIHAEGTSDTLYFDTASGDVNQRGVKLIDHNPAATNAVLRKSGDANIVALIDADITVYNATGGASLFDPAGSMADSPIMGRISVSNDADLRNFDDGMFLDGDLFLDAAADATAVASLDANAKVRIHIGSTVITKPGTTKLGVKTISAGGAITLDDCDILRLAGGSVTSISSLSNGNRYGNRFDIINDQSVACAVAGFESGSITMYPGDVLTVTQYDTKFFANPTVEHSTYTPTITSVTNVDATTAAVCHYERIGNHVKVWGSVAVDPTAGASTATEIGISLPIASAFTVSADCRGNANTAGTAQQGSITADATNDRAKLNFVATSTANTEWVFSFSYEIK